MNRTALVCTSIASLALLSAAALLAPRVTAGPLTPPAGPVASTYKTLSEIEPRIAINSTNTPGDADSTFRITAPGSYYLPAPFQGDITNVANKWGIEIDADNVTIDLMGFSFRAINNAFGGIRTVNPHKSVTIRNGHIDNWTNTGVDLSSAEDSTVEDLHVSGIPLGGGIVTGNRGHVRRCVVRSVGTSQPFSTGVFCASDCVLEDVTATACGGDGIDAQLASSLSRCTAADNLGSGFAASSAAFHDCVARGNTIAGFTVSAGCSLSNCSAYLNVHDGISAGVGITITGSSSFINSGNGISVLADATITGSTISRNVLNGIVSSNVGTLVSHCSITENKALGIFLAADSTIVDNDVSSNALDGISVSSRSIIRGNTCAGNGTAAAGGAGVHIIGSRNRVEGNHCALQDKGLLVEGTVNIIIRNTCTGNTTNWSIVAGNSVGPIVAAGTNAAAISGNTFAGSLTSTDPNANFTH